MSKTVGTGGLFGRHAMGENTTIPGEVLLFIFQQGLRDHIHRGTLVISQQYSKILLSYHNNKQKLVTVTHSIQAFLTNSHNKQHSVDCRYSLVKSVSWYTRVSESTFKCCNNGMLKLSGCGHRISSHSITTGYIPYVYIPFHVPFHIPLYTSYPLAML